MCQSAGIDSIVENSFQDLVSSMRDIDRSSFDFAEDD